MQLKYYKELDGVRGLAAIMVMFFHFFQGNPVHGNSILNALQKVSVFGQTGVTLFFVLSGFLITRILLETRENNQYFKIFYLRRSFRIFPLYFFFLILSYFILPIVTGDTIPPFHHQIYYWLYIQNIAATFKIEYVGPGHFWSLAVEEQFYLIWPFVVFWIKDRHLKKIIYSLIILSLITRMLLVQNGYGSFYFTFSNTDALAFGALLASIEKENQTFLAQKSRYSYYLLGAFIPTVILWLFTGGKGFDLIQIVKNTLLAFVYFSFLGLILSSKGSWLTKIFLARPLQYSGKVSYGLYVYHPLCYWIIEANFHGLNFIVLFCISLMTSYLIATLSFFFFELPILKLKNRFEYQKFEKLETKEVLKPKPIV